MRFLTGVLVLVTLVACSDLTEPGEFLDWSYTIADFSTGDHGWKADFTDFPPGWEEQMELDSGYSTLPSPLSGRGLFVSSFNQSDDVFMYLRRQLDNLVPNQRYSARFQVEYVTTVGKGCIGIGGSPGEAVYLKAGITPSEPMPVIVDGGAGDYVVLSVDKGGQATIGPDAVHLGTIGREGGDCHDSEWGYAVRWNEDAFEFRADDEGTAWIYVGTDSGFEGRTKIYYTRIALKLTPLATAGSIAP